MPRIRWYVSLFVAAVVGVFAFIGYDIAATLQSIYTHIAGGLALLLAAVKVFEEWWDSSGDGEFHTMARSAKEDSFWRRVW